MRWLKSVSNQLRHLFRKDAIERETDQELRFHLERQVATNIAAGLSPEQARRAALLDCLANVYQGFEPASVLRAEISLPQKVYTDSVKITNFYQQLLRGTASLSGVQHASLVTNPPASNVDNETTFFSIVGQPAFKTNETPSADLQIASPDFFDTLRVSSVA